MALLLAFRQQIGSKLRWLNSPILILSSVGLLAGLPISIATYSYDFSEFLLVVAYGAIKFLPIAIVLLSAIWFSEYLKRLQYLAGIKAMLLTSGEDRGQSVVIAHSLGCFFDGSGLMPEATVPVLLGELGVRRDHSAAMAVIGYSFSSFGLVGTTALVLVQVTNLKPNQISEGMALPTLIASIITALCLWLYMRIYVETRILKLGLIAISTGLITGTLAVSLIYLGMSTARNTLPIVGIVSGFLGTVLALLLFSKVGVWQLGSVRDNAWALLPYAFLTVALIAINIASDVLGISGIKILLGFPHTEHFNPDPIEIRPILEPSLYLIASGIVACLVTSLGRRRYMTRIEFEGSERWTENQDSSRLCLISNFRLLFITMFDTIVNVLPTILGFVLFGGLALLLISTGAIKDLVATTVPFLVESGLPLIVVSPFVGLLASFIVGSATVANVLFGGYLFALSQEAPYSPQLIVSLGSVGACLGGFFALLKVLIAANTAGIDGMKVWKRTSWISILSVSIFTVIALAATSLMNL